MVNFNILINNFNQIQKGFLNKKIYVSLKSTKFLIKILDCIQNEGYILGYSYDKYNKNKIKVYLKYDDNFNPILTKFIPISKPSRKMYITYKILVKYSKYFANDFILILSTNKGIITHQQALKLGIGGKVICKLI